jgi:hypothetical protein
MTDFDTLQTGDIILFEETSSSSRVIGLLDWIIKRATHSGFTHVAFVLRDPTFIHPSLKGLYIWESGWEGKPDPQDGKVKLGVQITPLHEYLHGFIGNVYIRRLEKGRESVTPEALEEIHTVVHDKPYDTCVVDWIEAWLRCDPKPQKTNRFWCSAFVSYILVKLGFVDNLVDWSIVRPSDLSSTSSYLTFLPTCHYSDDIEGGAYGLS